MVWSVLCHALPCPALPFPCALRGAEFAVCVYSLVGPRRQPALHLWGGSAAPRWHASLDLGFVPQFLSPASNALTSCHLTGRTAVHDCCAGLRHHSRSDPTLHLTRGTPTRQYLTSVLSANLRPLSSHSHPASSLRHVRLLQRNIFTFLSHHGNIFTPPPHHHAVFTMLTPFFPSLPPSLPPSLSCSLTLSLPLHPSNRTPRTWLKALIWT